MALLKKNLRKAPTALKHLDKESVIAIKEFLEEILAQYPDGIFKIPKDF